MKPFTWKQNAEKNDTERSGRAIFILVWFVAVVIAGGFGFMVGVIGPKALRHIRVFGVTVFHPTPLGLALYGMSAVGLALTMLYIAVEIASRFDEYAPES
jgi:uncharacterized BrkB/YihY/UPF0761 family membrane protein